MRLPILAPTLLLLAAGTAQAVELAGIEFHGFFSQGYVNSEDNEWLVDRSTHGSFDLNDAAVNASYDATDRLRFAVQIYANDLYGDPQMVNSGSFDQKKAAKVNLDYAYAQYTFADQIGLRAGRVKQAYGFYNDVRDIDAARSTAILPQSVYDNRDREMNYLVNGVAGFGAIDLAQAGKLEWQAYYGTINVPIDGTVAEQYESSDIGLHSLEVDSVGGGLLMWSPPVEGLRLGFSFRHTNNVSADAYIRANALAALLGPHPELPLEVEFDSFEYYLGSIEYTIGDLLLQGEYQRIRSYSTFQVTDPIYGPFINPGLTPTDADSEGWYVLGAYRINERLEAGVLFSMYSTEFFNRNDDNWNKYQQDWGVFAGCNLTDWWTVKAEAHYVEGAALLDYADRNTGYFPFNNQVVSTEYWSYFVARTTVSF